MKAFLLLIQTPRTGNFDQIVAMQQKTIAK